jgi:hypothetical protein
MLKFPAQQADLAENSDTTAVTKTPIKPFVQSA